MDTKTPRRRAIRPAQSNPRPAQTGEHCPATGWWSTDGGRSPYPLTVFVMEGSLMPAALGQRAVWRLV
ncbi:hypothetical protein [Sinomonas halotolerans]|uniref:Uncharacterized protein n=1 Tax=Sinomonas halotolerans TaxID=1644133 RepID=A0ABU9WY79_9MICC